MNCCCGLWTVDVHFTICNGCNNSRELSRGFRGESQPLDSLGIRFLGKHIARGKYRGALLPLIKMLGVYEETRCETTTVDFVLAGNLSKFCNRHAWISAVLVN